MTPSSSTMEGVVLVSLQLEMDSIYFRRDVVTLEVWKKKGVMPHRIEGSGTVIS